MRAGILPDHLHFPIYTQADTLDELRDMVRDAVLCHFGDEPAPALIRLHIVKDEVLAV